MFKTANNDSISRPNSRPKLPFPGNGKGKFKMLREGKGREIWGMYSRESRETRIPAHPCYGKVTSHILNHREAPPKNKLDIAQIAIENFQISREKKLGGKDLWIPPTPVVSGKGFLAPANAKGNWKSHSRFTGRERELKDATRREGKFEACNPGKREREKSMVIFKTFYKRTIGLMSVPNTMFYM